MPPIRIVLADPSARLRAAICTALTDQPDLVVVGEPVGEVDILLSAAEADVVMLGMAGAAVPVVAERLLDEYPRVAVLAVDVDGGHGLVYRLRPQVTEIDDVTSAGLATAIRWAAGDLAV